uniref:Uncharacterized protein n=1 Tax=Arundo donax TaxID=35708 RepID=A0A0A9FYS7_ARUDO
MTCRFCTQITYIPVFFNCMFVNNVNLYSRILC